MHRVMYRTALLFVMAAFLSAFFHEGKPGFTDVLKNRAGLDLPIADKKLVMAHCMPNIIRYKGHKLEDSCNPDFYSASGNISSSIGGLTQVYVLSDQYLAEKSLDEAVEFEMRTAIASGIDGFQFYYTLGNDSWDDIIKAYFRVADKKSIDFKFTFCISHPSGDDEAGRIADFARRINSIMKEAGKDSPHWLRTPDGQLVIYTWYGDGLADVPATAGGLPAQYYVANAYKKLADAVGERFACIVSVNEQISKEKLNRYLDYFPAVWLWTLPYTNNYIGKMVAAECKKRKRTFTGSAFPDFYTSKVLKRGTWDMYHFAEDAAKAGIKNVERKYIVTGLSYNFRKQLDFSIEKDVPIINIITWNDYPEGHHLGPEINHTDGFSLLLKYYKSVWQQSSSPYAGKDIVIAFYKKYNHKLTPSPFNIPVVEIEKGGVPVNLEDSIEVVTILKEKGIVSVKDRDIEVGAGLQTIRFAASPGAVNVEVKRNGAIVEKLVCPEWITDKPYRTDRLTYSYSNQFASFYRSIFGDYPLIHSEEYKQGVKATSPPALSASMGKLSVAFQLDDKGRPQYAVQFNQQPVVNWSGLGFSLDVDTAFYKGFELIGSNKSKTDGTWAPVWGETKTIRNQYEELAIQLRQKQSGRLLNITFRVFPDGVGFRYEFPKQAGLKYFVVKDELTQFKLTGDHKAFWIPGDYDSNEYSYTTSKLSEIDAGKVVKESSDIAVRTAPDPGSVQTPLMMKTIEGLYVNIHEAALVNYSAMQLHVEGTDLYSSLVPDPTGDKAYLHAPAHTPWRTIIVSDKATEILSSTMVLNLNEPAAATNTSWIKPMKFVGVWWEMQTGKSTWSYSDFADSTNKNGTLIPNGRHGAATANVKRYIDFAAKNGIGGVLVEGWNTGWEDWFGNWKENVFDFVTPYPDFDMAAITAYAKSKGVTMIMHNETSGSATNYERQLDTAFKLMNQYGYPAVKTGYVGKIIPREEHHDGQWMINHYERVAKKALQHKVMIDVHEPVRPTGLHRTYPNWMASEAARGNEFNAFSIGSPPEHETILPFTRLIGGPMDYTPGIFKLKGYAAHAPERQLHSTLAKQLALYVTIYSPLQMAADYPENYEARPDAFQFIKDVPVDWDDTRIVEAEPGDYITIARKGKGTNDWFIGAVTDENSRTAVIPLSFLDKGKKYTAIIYRDADNADWKSNPEAYKIEKIAVQSTSSLTIRLAAGGGCAVSISR